MGVVYIARYFLSKGIMIPYENDRLQKREKKEETLCVNNHGHQASAEYMPERPMSLVKSGKIEWICYKSSHFEIQQLTLYFESGPNPKGLRLMLSIDGPRSPRWAVYRVSCSDKCVGLELNLLTYNNQNLSSVPTHLQSRQERRLK